MASNAKRRRTFGTKIKDQTKDIKFLYGLQGSTGSPRASNMSFSFAGGSSTPSSTDEYARLKTQGDTMVGGISYFPKSVIVDVDDAIDIRAGYSGQLDDSYSSYLYLTSLGVAPHELETIDGASHLGQLLHIETVPELTLKHNTGNIAIPNGADFTAEEIIQYEILHGKIRKVSAEIDNLIDSYEAEEERKRLSIEFIKAEVRMNELLEDSSSSLAQNVLDNNEETGKSYQNMTSDLDDYISKIMERQEVEGITFDMLEDGADRYEEMKQREVELAMGAANQTLGAWQNATNERMKNDLNALKATEKYEKASADQKKAMEKKVTDEYKTQRQAQFRLNQASNLADIYMSTASAFTESLPNIPLATAMAVAGAIQAGVVLSQQMPEYQYGGLIGGNTHAQGGTPLIAEQGEYIVNRDAVESLGIDTMDSINAGGGAGMVINITGNLLTDDFVEDVLIEKIQDAVYRGGELA